MPDNTTPAGAVFLSYASQDAGAAKRICDALRAAGIEVWFDQDELVGGDAWDQKIRGQIGSCALFMPVVSAGTQARLEGYFRLEWKLAAQRTHTMADEKAFLLPIVIDGTRDAEARVPVEFKAIQWTRLPGGETPPAFVARVRKLLSANVAGLVEPGPGSAAPATNQAARRGLSKWWWLAPIFGMTMALALVFKERRPEPAAPAVTPPAAVSVAPAVSAESSATRPEQLAADPATASKSVAVLAFANLSDDKANEYFSDGISEELLNVLAKIPELKVAARTSAFYFKGKEVPVPEIARQLGVAYVVEGSVRKAGDKVRITAQLIKAADGFHVWSDTFTRDLKDVFGVQDEIAGLIAKNLELKMGFVRASAQDAIDPEAYQEYLQGRAAFAKAGAADLREAAMHFSRATALEPKYAPAWIQLASVHTRLGRWGGAPTLQAWAAARAAIDKALALEPDSPEVLVALGWIQRTAEWDWRGAERSFRRALQLQPNQPEAMAGAAVLLFNIGQTDEAYRLGQQAAQLDPLNAATHIDLSLMFYMNKNWTAAERSARRALELAPGGSSYRGILSWSLIAQGRLEEAEVEIARETHDIERTNAYGLLAIARGQNDKARARAEQMEEVARSNPDVADLQMSIAWISSLIGDKDRAFTALDRARTTRDPSLAWLRNSFYLQPLESDPRWDKLLHQLGLADEQLK